MSEGKRYVQQHIEPERPPASIPEALRKPLVENVEFSKYGGEISAEKNGNHFYLQYSASNTNEVLSGIAAHMGSVEHKAKVLEHANDWKLVRKLIITDAEGNELLNLEPLINLHAEKVETWLGPTMVLKRQVGVFFPATNNVPSFDLKAGGAQVRPTDMFNESLEYNVLLTENITSPATLVTLLHEIGHVKRPTADSAILNTRARYVRYLQTRNKNLLTAEEKTDPELEDKIFQVILEEERDAWAYALKEMRPLIKAGFLEKKDVLDFLHTNALQSYSDTIRKVANPSVRERIRIAFFGYLNTRFGAQ
jgi:hypothetical protein